LERLIQRARTATHAGVHVDLLPIVLVYTAWVYRVLWGRVAKADIATNRDLY
jgi:cytochrome d ubiquinol oxidase subunit II